MDGSLGLEITLVVVGVILSIFFTISESIFAVLGHMGVRQVVNTRGKPAEVLKLWLTHAQNITNIILFGKTFSYVAVIIISFDIFIQVFDGVQIWLASVALAVLFLIFIEFLPKIIANHYAAELCIGVMVILKGLYYLFYPISVIMSYLGKAFLMLVGGTDVKRIITEDDLAYLIDVSEENGVLEGQKQQMLSNIFDISDKYVKTVMVPRTDMVAVERDITKEKFLAIFKENEYSRIPVYEDTLDRIQGIVYVKDILNLTGKEWKMEDLMAMMHPALFVPETKKLDDMLRAFQKSHQQMAVVVDEYGGVAGIVTMEDVLEEIVGDIWDEYDNEDDDPNIIRLSDTHFRVDARANIEDFCKYFLLERTEDMQEYDTVGGLIYDIAAAIPSVGDTFRWRGFTVTVHSMDDNKLKLVDFIKDSAVAEEDASQAKEGKRA